MSGPSETGGHTGGSAGTLLLVGPTASLDAFPVFDRTGRKLYFTGGGRLPSASLSPGRAATAAASSTLPFPALPVGCARGVSELGFPERVRVRLLPRPGLAAATRLLRTEINRRNALVDRWNKRPMSLSTVSKALRTLEEDLIVARAETICLTQGDKLLENFSTGTTSRRPSRSAFA
jgi:hypothetical protein